MGMGLRLFLALLLAMWPGVARAEPVSTFIGITAIVESIIGASAITVAGVTVTAAAIGGFIVSSAALVGLSVLSGMANKPKLASDLPFGSSVQSAAQSIQTPSRLGITSRQLTMGNVLRSGNLFFEAVKGPYLYRGYILAHHEIDGVTEKRLGTTVIKTDPVTMRAIEAPYFDGSTCFLAISIRNGTADQEMDPILAADFPSLSRSFRQRGLATAVVKMYRGSSAAVASSVWGNTDPAFLFLVRGKKFFDPRDPEQDRNDSSTWTWKNNAAICTAGWLNDPDGGNVPWEFIDLDFIKTAADACDDQMQRLDGTTEPRYTINGVSDTTQDPNQVLTDLISSMIGEYSFVDGKYALVAGKARTASRTLTEASARGTLDVVTERPWQDYVNSVSTSFVAKNRDYQVATGPVYEDLARIASDGTRKPTTIQLPFVDSDTQVQRIAKYTIRRSQLGGSLQRGEDIEAMRLSATDIVRLEYTGGLTSLNKEWELLRLTEADRIDEYRLQLAEYDGDFLFSWNPSVDERDWTQAELTVE